MPDLFHTRIRRSLADENLQAALDANAERRVRVWKEALASLANPEELRRKAHTVREDVIEHLDEYLEQFSNRVSLNGIEVHYAVDATQAIKTILEIASKQGARLIAKSKTMVSEEIGLNHALEKNALEVVETDLGEYIVQLRGEHPSHIITPAAHLRRQDVGRLFEEKLGVPYTEDISLMTNLARRTLRQVFLEADIGISGVNFGVVESGTLCVVTNEGNGRMVTTLPRTHIALMGIERMVPTLNDLALMLSLLPRSATGQKLSVYTSLLNAPRRDDDPDGPEQRHLILVDNGRKHLRGSGLQEILLCIRCGACLNACPVFREIGGHGYMGINGEFTPYSGPLGSVISPALFGQAEFGHLARASSLCGACREACPVDIDLPKLLLRIRAGMGEKSAGNHTISNAPASLKLGIDLFSLAAASPRRFALAQWLAGIFGRVSALFTRDKAWLRLPAFSGWGYSKDFPCPANRSFHARHTKQNFFTGSAVATPALKGVGVPAELISTETKPLNRDEIIYKFTDELKALGGKFTLCPPEQVLATTIEILQQHDLHEILAWDAAQLPEGLLDGLARAGIDVRYPRAETIQESSRIKAGLTGAAAGIAETGSLLVLGGPGMPLTASLLPEIHIALLREVDIFERQSQVLNRKDVIQAPAGVLISGPSRTSDIEMTLTIGVHGPGGLFVICIKDSET